MSPAALASVGVLLSLLLYVWHRHYYDYRIGRYHLSVQWLGITVRRVRFSDIDSISKRQKLAAESWANTWRPRHRILVIRRKSGWRREVVITPAYRYEFRNQLEQAMRDSGQ